MTNDVIHCTEIECPLCGESEYLRLYRNPDVLHHVPGVFQAVRCNGCSHVYTNPCPDRDSLAACYPEEYGCHSEVTNDPKLTDGDESATPEPGRAIRILRYVPGLRVLYRYLADKKSEVLLSPSGGGRALELGCGRGDFLARLQDLGWNATGVDVVERSVRLGKLRGLDVRHGTLTEQAFDDDYFDMFCGWMVFEHTPDPVDVIQEAARIVRTDGYLAMSVPNFGAIERRVFARYWLGLELPRHLQHFTPRSLRDLLESNGFQVERLVHQESAFNLVASLGLFLREATPFHSLGARLIRFVDNPGMLGELSLSPLAKILGWTRQSGRMTVLAKRS